MLARGGTNPRARSVAPGREGRARHPIDRARCDGRGPAHLLPPAGEIGARQFLPQEVGDELALVHHTELGLWDVERVLHAQELPTGPAGSCLRGPTFVTQCKAGEVDGRPGVILHRLAHGEPLADREAASDISSEEVGMRLQGPDRNMADLGLAHYPDNRPGGRGSLLERLAGYNILIPNLEVSVERRAQVETPEAVLRAAAEESVQCLRVGNRGRVDILEQRILSKLTAPALRLFGHAVASLGGRWDLYRILCIRASRVARKWAPRRAWNGLAEGS